MSDPGTARGPGSEAEASPGPGPRRPGSAAADRPPEDPDPWQGWKKFGLFLGGGFLLVFLVEMVALVRSLSEFEMGHERGAVWAMLLMIFATLLAVGAIGGGLLLAIRRQGREERRSEPGRPAAPERRSGPGRPPESERPSGPRRSPDPPRRSELPTAGSGGSRAGPVG